MLRILLLNQFYAPDVAPTGQVLHDLARTLAARGHEVTVFCSRRSYDGGQRFPRRQILDGVHVQRLPSLGFGRRSTLGKLAGYGSFYAALAARLTLMTDAPDVIVSLTTPPYIGLLGKFAAKLHQRRHVHWIMDLYPDVMTAHGMVSSRSWLYHGFRMLTRGQLSGASLVVALGPQMAARVAGYLDEKTREQTLRWVPLWADESLAPWPENEPNPLRVARAWAPGDFVLMYSGNMGLGHRLGEFFAAAQRLGAQGPRWAFVGGGKRRAEIETCARENPQARIELWPYVPPAQLRASLCAADVHLASLDSRWQGLIIPSKLQGIFAAGKPVIFVGGRDNEIAAWISQAHAGWVVAENDVDGLLAAVREAQDPQVRAARGRAAWAFARAHFQMRTHCAQLADLIDQCIMKS